MKTNHAYYILQMLPVIFSGEQKRKVFCVRDDNGEEVEDSNCEEDEKPSHKQKCNTQPCPARLVYVCGVGRERGLGIRKGGGAGGERKTYSKLPIVVPRALSFLLTGGGAKGLWGRECKLPLVSPGFIQLRKRFWVGL